jgi:hypothetical protein
MTAKRRAALTAGLTLLLTSGCATTVSGSGTRAASLTGGQPSTTATAGSGLVPYKGDHFTVSMPGTPSKSNEQISTAAGPTALTLLTVEKGGNTFFVAYADLPAGTPFDLNGAARGAAKNAKGQLADLKHLTYRGAAAVDFRIVNAGGSATGFQRVLDVDDRLYELLAVVPGTDVQDPPTAYPAMRDSLTF